MNRMCVLLLEHDESCNGHKQQQDGTDNRPNDDLHNGKRIAYSKHMVVYQVGKKTLKS